MKKLFLITMIFSAFSCQDMMTDEASSNSQVDSDFALSMKDQENAIPPFDNYPDTVFLKIVEAFDKLKKDTEYAKRMSLSLSEHARRVEISKQIFLIFYNLRDEMPESLRDSEDWVETMKRDPAAAEFGNKLKAKFDELPPELSNCDDFWDLMYVFAKCAWLHVKTCFLGCIWDRVPYTFHDCVSIYCDY